MIFIDDTPVVLLGRHLLDEGLALALGREPPAMSRICTWYPSALNRRSLVIDIERFLRVIKDDPLELVEVILDANKWIVARDHDIVAVRLKVLDGGDTSLAVDRAQLLDWSPRDTRLRRVDVVEQPPDCWETGLGNREREAHVVSVSVREQCDCFRDLIFYSE